MGKGTRRVLRGEGDGGGGGGREKGDESDRTHLLSATECTL